MKLLITALKQIVLANPHQKNIEKAFQEIDDNWDKYKGSDAFKSPMKPDKHDKEAFIDIVKDVSDIYRCVGFSLDEGESFEDKLQLNKLGIYWSFDRDYAICYWGRDEDYHAIFEAKVNPDDIDWVGTFLQYVTPDYSGEYEIRIKQGRSVTLLGIDIETNRKKHVKSLDITPRKVKV